MPTKLPQLDFKEALEVLSLFLVTIGVELFWNMNGIKLGLVKLGLDKAMYGYKRLIN